MSVAALIVAAGRGTRAGDGLPKQYRSVAGRTILARTLETFLRHPHVDTTLVVIHPDDEDFYRTTLAQIDSHGENLSAPARPWRRNAAGFGPPRTRGAGSKSSPDLILVHDAARPFVDAGFVDRAIAAVEPMAQRSPAPRLRHHQGGG